MALLPQPCLIYSMDRHSGPLSSSSSCNSMSQWSIPRASGAKFQLKREYPRYVMEVGVAEAAWALALALAVGSMGLITAFYCTGEEWSGQPWCSVAAPSIWHTHTQCTQKEGRKKEEEEKMFFFKLSVLPKTKKKVSLALPSKHFQ